MPPCRCLLMESNQEEMSKTVEELVLLMPEDKKAAESTRRSRLEICRQCEHLADGTCARCGCFVELRAAVRAQRCPDVPSRWNRQD